MKKYIIVLASWLIFGCDDNEANNSPSQITSISGSWKVITYEHLKTDLIISKTDDNSWGLDVIVTFNDTAHPHKISGLNTSNQLSGEFSYESERLLKIIEYTPTEINQPEWGNEFDKVMSSEMLEYTLSGPTLKIYYNNKNSIVTLTRQ